MADTPAAARVRSLVIEKFGVSVSSNGGVCRKIANSSSWSQHSWGNALDIWPGAGNNLRILDEVYAFLSANKEALNVRVLCWDGKGGCTTGHKDHVHADFWPKGIGTPPCAGGRASFQNKDGTTTGSPGGSTGEVTDTTGLPDPSTGPSSSRKEPGPGVPVISASPEELREGGCQFVFDTAKDVIARRAAASNAQRVAMKERLFECAERNPLWQGFDSLIHNPDDFLSTAGGVIADATPLDEIAGFVGALMNPQIWIRVAAGLGGIALAGIGVILVARSQGVGDGALAAAAKVAKNVTPVGRAATAIEAAT